jgi:hypothetical protein
MLNGRSRSRPLGVRAGGAASAVETQEATLAARIDAAAHNVPDLDKRLEQIDRAVEVGHRERPHQDGDGDNGKPA